MKRAFAVFAILVALSSLTFAAEDVSEGKRLVESKADCIQLSDYQLELIGDYYMEQMHPGEAHELMDEMMGGEGSEELRQVHVNMALRLYCNEQAENAGMMGMGMMPMMGSYGGGLVGSWQAAPYGMMSYGYPCLFGWGISDILLLVLLLGLIIVVYLHIWDKVKKQKRAVK